MSAQSLATRCPELAKIVDLVARQNPLQRKRIGAFLERQGESYLRFAEELSRTLNQSFLVTEGDRTRAASSYNKMCKDFLYEQIRFNHGVDKFLVGPPVRPVFRKYNGCLQFCPATPCPLERECREGR